MARPKKNVTVNEEVKTEAVEEKKPARRGRPKKSSVPAEEVETVAAEVVTADTPVKEDAADEKQETVKKEPVKRGRRKKTETVEAEKKEPVKRGRRKKTEIAETEKKETAENTNAVMEITTIVQYRGNEIEQREMIAKVEEAWRAEGNTAPIEAIKMYVKPEDGKIYYVVNGLAGSCDLF